MSVRWPGAITHRTRIHVNAAPDEILRALQYAPGHEDWDEEVREVLERPGGPGRRILRHADGRETWLEARPGERELELLMESPDRPGFRRSLHARVRKTKCGAVLRIVEKVRGAALLPALGGWLDDAAADRWVHFRDRLEGRRSHTNKAAALENAVWRTGPAPRRSGRSETPRGWRFRAALYRVRRLWRAILFGTLAPLLAFYAGAAFHPEFGPLLFTPQSLMHVGSPDHAFITVNGLSLDGMLAFILVVGGAFLAIALFCAPLMSGYVMCSLSGAAVLFAMPWLWHAVESRAGGGTGTLLFMTVLVLGMGLVSLFERIRMPGIWTTRHSIHIARPRHEVRDVLMYAPDAPVNRELFNEIRQHPDIPGQVFLRNAFGVDLQADFLQGRDEWELVVELRMDDDDRFLETTVARLHESGDGTLLEIVERARNVTLSQSLKNWVNSTTADYYTFLRDRLEGRQSLSLIPGRLEAMAQPDLTEQGSAG